MKELVLKCGAVVLLDNEDYERIPKTAGIYLKRNVIIQIRTMLNMINMEKCTGGF